MRMHVRTCTQVHRAQHTLLYLICTVELRVEVGQAEPADRNVVDEEEGEPVVQYVVQCI